MEIFLPIVLVTDDFNILINTHLKTKTERGIRNLNVTELVKTRVNV